MTDFENLGVDIGILLALLFLGLLAKRTVEMIRRAIVSRYPIEVEDNLQHGAFVHKLES